MLSYFYIAVGGALGSVLRYWWSGLIANCFGAAFPWGTLIVNVTGSFVIGFFDTLTGDQGRWLAPTSFRQFFMIGICGGYTTFSSFSLQTLQLTQKDQWLWAGANIVGSVGLCLLGVWLGHVVAATINLRLKA
jgi:fluoride exporter